MEMAISLSRGTYKTSLYNTFGTPPKPTIQHLIDIWESSGKHPPALLKRMLLSNQTVQSEMHKWGLLILATEKRRTPLTIVNKHEYVAFEGSLIHGGPGKSPQNDGPRALLFLTASRKIIGTSSTRSKALKQADTTDELYHNKKCLWKNFVRDS